MMELSRSEQLLAWTAASLAAIWAALLAPMLMTVGPAIVALPYVCATMLVLGIPAALLAKGLNCTNWIISGAAGAGVGIMPFLALALRIRSASPAEFMLFLLIFAGCGLIGGIAFRAVLGRYRIVGSAIDQSYASDRYDPRPSAWPAALALSGLTAAGLAFVWSIRP